MLAVYLNDAGRDILEASWNPVLPYPRVLNQMIIDRHDLMLVLKRHALSPVGACDAIALRIYSRVRNGSGRATEQRVEVDSVTGSGDAQPSLRDDEDDHDLLTFAEAGARLQHEIALVQARIADLETQADIDSLALAASRERLAALKAAAARNNRPAITDESFRSFFGYDGRPRTPPC
jgi:hypothetical protein